MRSGAEGRHDFKMKELVTSSVEPVSPLVAKLCSATSLRDSTRSTDSPFRYFGIEFMKGTRVVNLELRSAI